MSSPTTSGASAPTTRGALRATPALVRAVLAVAVALGLAVLVGRPQVVIAALPLLVWVVLALGRRHLRGEDEPGAAPTIATGRRTLEEGGTTTVAVSTAPGTLTALAVPLRSGARFSPKLGAAAGDGEVRMRVSANRWGRVRVGPLHVVQADGLGAFRTEQTLPPVDVRVVPSSTVLDAPVEVPTPIGVSGAHLSRRRGDGTALSEVREFRPGDRLHRINWRVTSRTGRLHTNATFTEQDTDVLLVTDTITDVQPAPWAEADAPTSLDMTVRATAAVARHYLAAGDRVSVFDIGQLIGPVRAGTGPRQLRVLTDALARAGRDDGTARSIHRLGRVRAGTLAVVCSPLLNDQAIAQIGVLVAHGADVIVVDTLPPSIGEVAALTGKPLRVDGTVSERFWAEAWALRRLLRGTTVRELRESGVPVIPWEGPSSLTPVLLSLAAARTAPRRRRS